MQAGNKVRMYKLITGCKKFRKRKLGFSYHAICRYITILTNKWKAYSKQIKPSIFKQIFWLGIEMEYYDDSILFESV